MVKTKDIVLRFVREKETKNTVRFQEVSAPGEPQVIGMLYIQKWAAGDIQKLKVTLKGGEDD